MALLDLQGMEVSADLGAVTGYPSVMSLICKPSNLSLLICPAR